VGKIRAAASEGANMEFQEAKGQITIIEQTQNPIDELFGKWAGENRLYKPYWKVGPRN